MFHLKSLAFLTGLALLASAATLPTLRADDTPSTTPAPAAQAGTIKGTVVDADGKALAVPAKVLLFAFHEHGHGHNKPADGSPPPERPKPIQTLSLTADDKGAYTFTDVPPGKYTIAAHAKIDDKKCAGRTAEAVVLDAGGNITADPITLHEGKPHDQGGKGEPGNAPTTAPSGGNQ